MQIFKTKWFQRDDKAFFIYGFSKNERSKLNQKELKALKLLATELLGYTNATLEKAMKAGELIEVNINGKVNTEICP